MTALDYNKVPPFRKKTKSMCFVLLQIQGKISKLGKIPLHSVLMVRINSYINLIEQVHSKSKFITKYV